MATRAKKAAIKRQKERNARATRLMLGIGGVLLVGMVMFIALSGSGGSGTGSGSAIDFDGRLLTGENMQLSDYRGEVVMLNFWATWCPPCRAEMPTIQDAYEQYHDEGFTVLAINNAEPISLVQPFRDAMRLEFPIVMDQTRTIQQEFAITSYPTSIFVDANGSVYAQHSGMVNELQLMNYIREGLARGA